MGGGERERGTWKLKRAAMKMVETCGISFSRCRQQQTHHHDVHTPTPTPTPTPYVTNYYSDSLISSSTFYLQYLPTHIVPLSSSSSNHHVIFCRFRQVQIQHTILLLQSRRRRTILVHPNQTPPPLLLLQR